MYQLKERMLFDIIPKKEDNAVGKKTTKKRKNTSKWMPPKGSSKYFYAASDYEFKERHPIGYGFLVFLGIAALLLPVVLYLIFVQL